MARLLLAAIVTDPAFGPAVAALESLGITSGPSRDLEPAAVALTAAPP